MENIKSCIKIRLIDMNNFTIEKEFDIDLSNKLLSKIYDYLNEFKKNGMNLEISRIKVFDNNLFSKWVINEIFDKYDIEDHQEDGNGIPDFKLINKNNKDDCFWLELKNNQDGLKNSQFNWMLNNIEKERIKLLFIYEGKPREYKETRNNIFGFYKFEGEDNKIHLD